MEPLTSPSAAPRSTPDPSLTRRVRFRASHRYHRSDWDARENARVFGEQGQLHEHDWTVDVTVRGPLDPATGWSVDLGSLDVLLRDIRMEIEGRNVGDALPEFGPGGRQPSTEELARWFWEQLRDRLPPPARLLRVRVAESDDLWAECVAGEGT